MTITQSGPSLPTYPLTSPEIPIDKKKPVNIPQLKIPLEKKQHHQPPLSSPYDTEKCLLNRMLKNQQYEDIVEYLEQLPHGKRLHWLTENAGYHVPLMFAQVITMLTYDDDCDIEDIACTIHFAELRIKQDLACYGYSEELQEIISDHILDSQVDKILDILNKLSQQLISKSYILHEIDKYRLVLPIPLHQFDNAACPPALDWRIYYHVNTTVPLLEKVKKSWNHIRQEVLENFKFTLNIINRKQFFSIEQLTPRHYECIEASCEYLNINFSHTDTVHSNILGLVFNRNKLVFNTIDSMQVNENNILIATLLHVWSEKNTKPKNEWLKRNAYGQHPILLHELGISTLELNPTFEGFKEAYEYILLGTLRVSIDAECASDDLLQEVPLILKAKYIGQLFHLAQKKCPPLEMTKIHWWEEYGAHQTFSQHVVDRFLKAYNDEKARPNPEWIFTHSHGYGSSKQYNYETMNDFAFPHWQWKKRRMSLINTLRALSEIAQYRP